MKVCLRVGLEWGICGAKIGKERPETWFRRGDDGSGSQIQGLL